MSLKTKEFSVKYSDEGNGCIEGYASTWIKKPDSYGDIVRAGAFRNTLEERWNGGKGIPLLWSHKMDDLSSYIGTCTADEDEKGLHFVGYFDATEEAQRVRNLYKDGRLSKFSFAYDILDDGNVTLDDGVKAHELRELDLFEISCVLTPANDDAGVVDIKSGRRNSKKDLEIMDSIEAGLKQALEGIHSLRDSADDTGDSGDPSGEPKANGADPKEPQGAPKERRDALEERIKKLNIDHLMEV